MRFALWQLMWSAIGLAIGAPAVVLIEHFAGTAPELVNVVLGSVTVFAGWGIGMVIYDRCGWPRWLQ